jgi:hypothetical protein
MNSYQLVAAKISVPCSEELWAKLKRFLDGAAHECMEDDSIENPDIDFEWKNGQLYAYSHDWGNPDLLDRDVLEVVGQILQEANLPYWEFGYAYYSDKQRPDSCGGGSFRITRGGDVVWGKTVWESEAPRHLLLGDLFRELDKEEEEEFRREARKMWKPGMSICPLWHPVVRDELEKLAKKEAPLERL